MSEPDPQQVRIDALFLSAIELSAEDRAGFLSKECVHDLPEVREGVEVLLRAHDQAEAETSFRDPSPLPGVQELGRQALRDPMLGKMVGVYELKRRIGRGGFGTVYLAERTTDYRQKVAVKLIRLDLVTEERIVDRFQLEREALASVQHNNIARLLDGGTTDEGYPYFVMEYIDGLPITEHCDQHRLDVEQRLQLFARVCDAVDHAHDLGYIHRDIKPSNVLVAPDGDPKLLDFGIAKLVDSRSRAQLVSLTEDGVPGTPEFASPEQVSGDRNRVGVRSDVYSLGVLLYQLVTGHYPYDLHKSVLAEVQRVICEEDPQRPSDVVLRDVESFSHGDSTARLSAEKLCEVRQTTPIRLQRRLRGDFENICFKALEKDPGRRYQSPRDLSDDVRRFLGREPVLAKKLTSVQRAWRWCRRNAGTATLVGCLALSVLTLAIAGPLVAWHQHHLLNENWSLAVEAQSRLARFLSAQATGNQGEHPQRSVLLALKSMDVVDTAHGEEALRSALANIGGTPFKGDACISAVGITEGRSLVTLNRLGAVRKRAIEGDRSAPTDLAQVGKHYVSAMSDNGRWLFCVRPDGVARAWDLEQPKSPRRLDIGNLGKVGAAAISNNGVLALAGASRQVLVWDLKRSFKSPTHTLEHNSIPIALAISRDGSRLVSTTPRAAWCWTLSEDVTRVNFTFEGNVALSGQPVDVAISGNADIAAVCSREQTLIWDFGSKAEIGATVTHSGRVVGVELDESGKHLFAVSNNEVFVWRHEDDHVRQLDTLLGHDADVTSLVVLEEAGVIATGSLDHGTRIWGFPVESEELSHHTIPRSLSAHKTRVSGLAFCNGSTLATASQDATVRFWNWEELTKLSPLPASLSKSEALYNDRQPITAFAISANSKHLVTVAPDGLRQSSLNESGSEFLRKLAGDGRQPTAVGVLNDGTIIAGFEHGRVSRWSLNADTSTDIPCGFGDQVAQIRILPDETLMVASSFDGQVVIVDVNSQFNVRSTYQHIDDVYDVDVSADGRWLVAACADGNAYLRDLSSSSENPKLLGDHQSMVTAVTISDDGSVVVSASEDQQLRLWRIGHTENPVILPAVSNYVGESLNISPDGKWVIAGLGDGQIHCHPLDISDLGDIARFAVGRDWTQVESEMFLVGE